MRFRAHDVFKVHSRARARARVADARTGATLVARHAFWFEPHWRTTFVEIAVPAGAAAGARELALTVTNRFGQNTTRTVRCGAAGAETG